jgi:hypothetical protein
VASDSGQQETPALQNIIVAHTPFDARKVDVDFSESCQRDVPKSPMGKGSGDADGRRTSGKSIRLDSRDAR